MKNAIVTGASGFIGSALVKELVSRDINVIALVLKGTEHQVCESDKVKIIPFELSDALACVEKIPNRVYDVFYHFAWDGAAGEKRIDTQLQLNNAQWSVDCLKLAKEIRCNRFVCAGSIMEDETSAAIHEKGNKPGLAYIYGSAKLVAHAMCMSVAANIGIDLLWAKITNAYGPGEVSPRLVNSTIRKCINGEVPQFTSGTQNYDFVYIDDVVNAFCLIGENGKAFHEYLIGSSHAKALKGFLLEMQASVAPEMDFIFGDVPFTGIDLPLEFFDCSLIEKDTGFIAKTNFAEGTKKTMEWILEQEDNI